MGGCPSICVRDTRVSAKDADNRGSSPPPKVEGSIKSARYFNDLADLMGAHQYPYEEYGERREERLGVKTQNPAFGGRAQAPPSEGAAYVFKRPSRHEFDHLAGNVGTAPAWVWREP
jgi:hypothetical protein